MCPCLQEMVSQSDPQLRCAPLHTPFPLIPLTHEQYGSNTTGKNTSTMRAFHRANGPSGRVNRHGSVNSTPNRSPLHPSDIPQRITYLKTLKDREPPTLSRPSRNASARPSRNHSPVRSGYQTPRELKEEQWRLEAEAAEKPSKLEMREMYKELGGRKSKGKAKLGATGGTRDKGGWAPDGGDW